MVAMVMAFGLLAGSFCLMIGAIAHNQLEPTYATALTIPVANGVSLLLALVALAIAFAARRRQKDSIGAKRAMLLAIFCAVGLALLFPLSNMGYLSRVS